MRLKMIHNSQIMKPSIIKHSSWFSLLLICFIVSIPLNNSYEIAAMMNGTLQNNTETLTPVYLKLFKDIFFILSVALLIASGMKSPSSIKIFTTWPFVLLNIFVCCVALTALYSFIFMPAEIVLMGIRGYWSIGFVYVGAMYCNINEHKIYRSIVAIFLLHFVLQVVQFITKAGFAVYSEMRSPGIFVIPATAGAFALLVYYFAIKFNSALLKLISIASLLLSNSTTGLLMLLVYYIYSYRNRLKPKVIFYPVYFFIVGMFSFVLILHLGEVSGRGDGASVSIMTRVSILYLALTHWTSLIFGMGMGMATSQALLSGYNNALIADNTYIGILYNAGIMPAIVMLTLVFLSCRYFENKLLFFILLGYSLTTVFFEMSPVVQIILILLGAHIGRLHATVSARDRNSGCLHSASQRSIGSFSG